MCEAIKSPSETRRFCIAAPSSRIACDSTKSRDVARDCGIGDYGRQGSVLLLLVNHYLRHARLNIA